jgi:hypothetical protein
MFSIIWHQDYPRFKTKNHCHCIEAHQQDGAGRVQHSLFAIKAANTMIIDYND